MEEISKGMEAGDMLGRPSSQMDLSDPPVPTGSDGPADVLDQNQREGKMPLHGGILFLIAVVIGILSLQAPMTSIAPVAEAIRQDIPAFDLGITGSLPIIVFAVSGLFAQRFDDWFTTERAVALAMGMIFLGQLLRAMTSSFTIFTLTSVIALTGIGFTYALLPALFKKYYPSRVGELTAAYSVLRAISSGVPALLAVRLLNSGGWRLELGIYAYLALLAVVPWGLLYYRLVKTGNTADLGSRIKFSRAGSTLYSSIKWPVAWALGITVGAAFFLDFNFLTYLPGYLSQVGYPSQTANSMVALYSMLGVIHSCIVPVALSRMKHPYLIMQLSAGCYLTAVLGLIFAPTGGLAWLWVIFACEGNMVIPGYLVLVNMRTRTTEGATNLSAFTITLGYLIASTGPLLFGFLLNGTKSYTPPLIMCLLISLVILVSGKQAVARVYLEDMKMKTN